MKLQQERRSNPYPWTWEVPLAIVVGVLLLMVFGLHIGRSLANVAAGARWQFTERTQLFSALPGLLRGDATTGLANPPPEVAGSGSLFAWVGATELFVCAAVAWGLYEALHRWGPGRVHGMASAAEAAKLLGVERLRKNAHILRPDLHTKGRR